MIQWWRTVLRYSAALRTAILVYRSCCLPFALILFSCPTPRCSFILHSCLPVSHLPPRNPLFFSALSFLRPLDVPRSHSSSFIPPDFLCPRENARTHASVINISSVTLHLSNFSLVTWKSRRRRYISRSSIVQILFRKKTIFFIRRFLGIRCFLCSFVHFAFTFQSPGTQIPFNVSEQ